MPKLEIDYSNTIIYKLCCNDVNVPEIYVGSTTNFKQRKAKHKNTCCNQNSRDHNYHVYQFIRANGGWSNWSMIEIEKVDCMDKLEALKRERHWLEQLKATLNKQVPSRAHKESCKNYYENNKGKIKQYHDNHKDEKKQYYEENKEKINAKYICPCGSELQKREKARHDKTNKHQSFLNKT